MLTHSKVSKSNSLIIIIFVLGLFATAALVIDASATKVLQFTILGVLILSGFLWLAIIMFAKSREAKKSALVGLAISALMIGIVVTVFYLHSAVCSAPSASVILCSTW